MNRFVFSGKDFDIKDTFDCGQCFRWDEVDGGFEGVAGEYWGRFEKSGEDVVLTTNAPGEDFWITYLDMNRDYGYVKEKVAVNKIMTEAVEYGKGIRILRQDFFETLMSFIISQRSSIPKIKSCVKKLCERYGRRIEGCGEFYTFPTPEELRNVTEEEYRNLGVGYRAPYLKKCVQAVLEGDICPEKLENMTTEEARGEVKKLYGVGDKVCDCVMLFALGKYDLFPSDVWIKRVMGEEFGSREEDAKRDGERMFGEYSGFAQQYLFYYRRSQR